MNIQPTRPVQCQNIGYIAKINKEKTEILNVYLDKKTACKLNGYGSPSALDVAVKNFKLSNGYYYKLYNHCESNLQKDFENKSVILVDDVLNSGKTLIYAVKLFLHKPVKQLSTLVLVDRSHTRFPVKADFVGLSLSTTLQERIDTDFTKKGKEAVYLV